MDGDKDIIGMKEHGSELDGLMRGKLHNIEIPPPPTVWPAVQRELRRRRRRVLFFWLFALAVPFGVGLIVLWPQKRAQFNSAPVSELPQATPNPASEPVLPNSAAKDPIVFTESNPGIKNTEEAEKLNAPSKPASAVDIISKYQKRQEKNPPSSALTALSSPTKEDNKTFDSQNPISEFSETPLVPLYSGKQELSNKIEVFANLNSAGLKPLEIPVRIISLRSVSAVNIMPPKPSPKRTPKNCYDFGKHPNAWVVEGYLGPTFVQKNLAAAAPTPALEEFREKRLTSENNDWGFNAGIRLMRILGRNFTLRTGLHYEQFVEVFEWTDKRQRIQEYDIDPITKEEILIRDEIVDIFRKNYNRFGVLDIPFQLGMELRSGRIGVSLQTGVSVNTIFWKKGLILNGDFTDLDNLTSVPFDQASGKETIFKSNTGLSMMSNMQFFAYLKSHTRLFVEPYYRSILKPVSVDNAPLEQRYSMWGIQVGVSQILK